MASPQKDKKSGVYYYRVRVPADLVGIRGFAKYSISLKTKDPTEARRLFKDVEQRLDREHLALRSEPQTLSQKQIVALAGEAYLQFIQASPDDPGPPVIWEEILRLINGAEEVSNLEQWTGPSVDQLLLSKGISVSKDTRWEIVLECHKAFRQAVEVRLRNARGDFRPDANAERFPKFEKAAPVEKGTLADYLSLWELDFKGAPLTIRDFTQKVSVFESYIGLAPV